MAHPGLVGSKILQVAKSNASAQLRRVKQFGPSSCPRLIVEVRSENGRVADDDEGEDAIEWSPV